MLAFPSLPVAPLPEVDSPTILVQAQRAGASPDTMATSIAGPLEKHLGRIADITEMTTSSTLGLSRITVQFGLSRMIDGAAREFEAAINAAHADLPTSLHTMRRCGSWPGRPPISRSTNTRPARWPSPAS